MRVIGFQRSSDQAAEIFTERGYEISKIYPQHDELVNEHHSAEILERFNEGLLLVQFLGHGGRYIWRTGPPDLKKNHDLFTLDHLDQLEPSRKAAGRRQPDVLLGPVRPSERRFHRREAASPRRKGRDRRVCRIVAEQPFVGNGSHRF